MFLDFLRFFQQIVDDALNLARSSQLDYVKALQTIQYLENEMEYAPWKAAFNGFDFILARFKPDESYLFEVSEMVG